MDMHLGDTQFIVDTCKSHGVLRNQAAYVLATAYHETAHTMKPITEMGSQEYLRSKPYWPFIGRGYVQITWEGNYKKASDNLGMPILTSMPPKPYFVGHPDALLDPQYAAPILVIGMVQGWFTGKKLADYITLGKSDFRNARRVINGTDRADLIASYARQYDDLLKADGYGVSSPQPAPPASVQPVPAHVTPAAPPAAPKPQPLPPPGTNKPAAVAGIFFAIAAMLTAFWHHINAFVSNLF